MFSEALIQNAAAIIVAHNHPSGNLTPSKADLAVTRELQALSERLGVPLLDHLVIGAEEANGFVSLAERNG